MTTLEALPSGLDREVSDKNERLIADIKRLNVLKYGDPETGQISARGKPSKADIHTAEARATRLYHANKEAFQEQALIDDQIEEN